MTQFFNRTEELALIEEAIDTLGNRQSLLRTPIIEFCGIEGIGKTTLLRKVEERCQDRNLLSIWADLKGQDAQFFLDKTRRHVEGKGPVVFILDALDEAEDQLPRIEKGLHDLVENSNLFVVLASRSIERFSNSRALSRKLKLQPLKPFDHESSKVYLKNIGDTLSAEVREIIYDWTQGYPLAMKMMVDAIVHDKLDPTQEEGRHRLLSLVPNRVLQQAIFSKLTGENDQLFHQLLLGLLSIPRRFNLVIMQALIEKYAADYRQPTSIAYINIPERINKGTNVLSWNMSRGGYCVDEPARNMFLLKNRIERPPRYLEINLFLAELNKQFAEQVSGPDRIRYLREFFYHLAISREAPDLPAVLADYLEQITQEEAFIQFVEEFRQDTELQEALDEHVNVVHSFIRQRRGTLQIPDSEAGAEGDFQ